MSKNITISTNLNAMLSFFFCPPFSLFVRTYTLVLTYLILIKFIFIVQYLKYRRSASVWSSDSVCYLSSNWLISSSLRSLYIDSENVLFAIYNYPYFLCYSGNLSVTLDFFFIRKIILFIRISIERNLL